MGNCIPTTPRARSIARVHAAELTAQYAAQRAAVMTAMQPPTQPLAPPPVAPPPVAPKPSYDRSPIAEAKRRIEAEKQREAKKLYEEDVADQIIILTKNPKHVTRIMREEQTAKREEEARVRRAKLQADKIIKKQKQQEERERIRQQQEAEYVVVRLERQQFENDANTYIAELMTNFQTGFKYEDLEKDEKAKELVKLYKFYNRFMDVAKQEYRKNRESLLNDYLTKYYAVVRTMPECGYDLHHAWGQARNTICT
jgi:hypothetical protein